MNTLKRTLALVATLAMTATAFASCGDDNKDSSSAAPQTTTKGNDDATDAPQETTAEPENDGTIDPTVKTGGETFTIVSWDDADTPKLIAEWKGLDYETITDQLAAGSVEGVKAHVLGVKGGEAAEAYDQLFNDGADIDVYLVEADWALKYINDETKTLALSKLGLGEKDFGDMYSYTNEIGKDSNGVLKGVSWQAAAGGFAYRADLAKDYLDVNSPAEMQAKIGDWKSFVEAAKTISEQTNGGVALADSLGGMWQAFACGRTTPWVKDNMLQIDDSCKDFADTAKQLWDCGGVTKNNQWTDDWTAAGVTGNAMGYFVSTWGFGGFFKDAVGGINGPQYGKWAVCQGPQSFYWGGTWLVVNKETDNGEECRDFILSATSDAAHMTNFAKNKPEYVNNVKVMDELISSNTEFDAKVSGNFVDNQNYFAELAENAKNIDFKGLITPYDATIKADFSDVVRKEFLDNGATWEATVEAFKDKVAESCPDLDWED